MYDLARISYQNLSIFRALYYRNCSTIVSIVFAIYKCIVYKDLKGFRLVNIFCALQLRKMARNSKQSASQVKKILRWEKKLSPKDASFIKHTVKLTFLPFMNQCFSVRCTICNSLCFC